MKKRKELEGKHLKVGRAYSMRFEMQDIYETSLDVETAKRKLQKLRRWMSCSRIPQMKTLSKTLKEHQGAILRYFKYKLTNAILEGTNNIVQNAKRRARGFRNREYFKTTIYLVAGDLPLDDVLKECGLSSMF